MKFSILAVTIRGARTASDVPATLFVAAKDDNGQAQALLMLAHALFQGGERLPALQAAGEALRLWSLAENRYGVAQVRAALGIFAILTGRI